MEEYTMTCKNEECGKEFLVRIPTDSVPGCKEKEEVTCPYCRTVNGTRMTSERVYALKIEDK